MVTYGKNPGIPQFLPLKVNRSNPVEVPINRRIRCQLKTRLKSLLWFVAESFKLGRRTIGSPLQEPASNFCSAIPADIHCVRRLFGIYRKRWWPAGLSNPVGFLRTVRLYPSEPEEHGWAVVGVTEDFGSVGAELRICRWFAPADENVTCLWQNLQVPLGVAAKMPRAVVDVQGAGGPVVEIQLNH